MRMVGPLTAITRLDVRRLFEPRLVPEFRSRAGVGRSAADATFKHLPRESAFRTSLETLK